MSECANVNLIYCFICTLPLPTQKKTPQRLKPNFSEAFMERFITDKYKQSNENIAKYAKLIIIEKKLEKT